MLLFAQILNTLIYMADEDVLMETDINDSNENESTTSE